MSFRIQCFQKFPIFLSIIFIVGLSGIPSVLAKKPGPTPPGDHINITEVVVNYDSDTITIRGEELDFGNPLEVTLGEFPPLLIVGVPTETEIVAGLPLNIPAGDYLLTVSTGNGQSQNDEYDLTIGGAGVTGPVGPEGPVGPAGAEGVAGPVGPAGAEGVAGPEGPAGAEGVAGPVGPAGADGVAGPVGPAGADGVAGPVGPAGPTGTAGPQGSMGPQGLTGPQGPQGEQGPAGGGGTLVVSEQKKVKSLQGGNNPNPQTFTVSCDTFGKVLSAGVEALPDGAQINTLTADLANGNNEAVIEITYVTSELFTPFIIKAICGSIQ